MGNIAQVRNALEGITGEVIKPVVVEKWYMVITRPNRDHDVVDSLRRHGARSFWPYYEELVTTRQKINDQPVRRLKRIGITPGIVFTPFQVGRDITSFLELVVGAVGIAKKDSRLPIMLEQQDIDILHGLEPDEDGQPKVEHTFKVGDKVRFIGDLNRRWPPGVVIKVARNGRISVLVSMMGRKVEVTPLPHQIERT